MRGLEITNDEFEAIIRCYEWNKLLVFDDSGNVFVDLKKYSELGHYLPVESEYQSYLVGFALVKKLYECPYRTQDDLICIHPPRGPIYEQVVVKKRLPIYRETKLSAANSACAVASDDFVEIEEVE